MESNFHTFEEPLSMLYVGYMFFLEYYVGYVSYAILAVYLFLPP